MKVCAMNVRTALVASLFALSISASLPASAATAEKRAVSDADSESAVSQSAQPDDASIDRMTAHAMNMMPIDRMFKTVIASNQAELESKLDATQYACLMRELSQDALTARKRGEVQSFAKANPDAFASGLKLLDDGAAELVAKAVESSMNGAEPDMTKASGEATIAFVTFAFDEQLADLRAITGFGDLNDPEGSGRATEKMMNALAADLSKTCAIPAEFFE